MPHEEIGLSDPSPALHRTKISQSQTPIITSLPSPPPPSSHPHPSPFNTPPHNATPQQLQHPPLLTITSSFWILQFLHPSPYPSNTLCSSLSSLGTSFHLLTISSALSFPVHSHSLPGPTNPLLTSTHSLLLLSSLSFVHNFHQYLRSHKTRLPGVKWFLR